MGPSMSTNTNSDQDELNIAGRTSAYFIRNKLTILIIVFAFLTGSLAFLITPREENPQIVVPAANVIVSKPGASPREIEQLIIKPLESILQGMPGIEHTYGMAMNSRGVVSVQFAVGEDKEDSLVKLYDHIMSRLDLMPPGTRQPLIKPMNVDDVPIVAVSLSSESLDDAQLRRIGVDVMEHLRRVENASVGIVHGGRARTINVNLDLERMKRFNVTLLDISQVLEATNVDMPSGTLIKNSRVATVQSGGMLKQASDVAELVVALYDHKPVYLKNVADITDGPGEVKHLTRIGYGPAYTGERPNDLEIAAITLAVAKRTGSNAVSVAQDVIAELERIRADIIPDEVKVDITRNDGKRADDAVNILMEHLAIAIASVVALLVIFLGWRAASIVTVTIPLILLITLAVGWAFGQSINRITLFALILSLGLLVDDSIVVVENIFRHYSGRAKDKFKTAVVAVNEIGKPTNIATLTVILAFLPMFWVTGMMGPYMAPIPFNVMVAMTASLFIAYTVAPWAAARWLKVKGHEQEGFEHHGEGWIEKLYAAIMRPMIRSAWWRTTFFVAVLGLMAAVFLMPQKDMVLFKMLPKNNNNTFNITIDMPEDTALEETDRVARLVGDVVRQHSEVINYETSVGVPGIIDFNGLLRGGNLKQGPHLAEVRVNLRDKTLREKSSIDIVLDLREPIAEVAKQNGANIKLVEDPPGPPVRATILAELYGPDYEELRRIAGELRDSVFENTADIVDIDDSVTEDQYEYKVIVDREKAALAGIMPNQVAQSLRAYLAGYDIGTVHIAEEKEPVAIRVRIPQGKRVDPTDLKHVFFTNRQGMQISLFDIVSFEKRLLEKPIYHKDQFPVVYVTGELGSTSQVYALLSMWSYLNENALPSGTNLTQYFMADPNNTGYSVRWDGEMRLTLDVFRDLGTAFGVAIVLIYLVLVGYYRSFLIPIIVMGAIPLTMVGVFPGHFAMEQHFTATSMIGVIALAGIVVRNSLLLIDFILANQREGRSVADSVLQAGVVRLRPIMLTALAIIFGTMIMLADPVFGGLAISLVFGTFASTVLTLFVIPLIYLSVFGKKPKA